MARVQHNCTGCVPIDASIIEVYTQLISTESRAEEAAERAEHAAEYAIGKSPYIGENGDWWEWDDEQAAFIDTGVQAQGQVAVDVEMSTTSTNPVQNRVVTAAVNEKQDTLVSGTNIKTVNGESLLGEGNIVAGDPNAVKYVEQSLTDAQKAQARTNIAAYQKPAAGIPATDLTSAAQASLGKADSAYQKPGSGIPKADLDSSVQTSLGKADTAIQDISGKQDVISDLSTIRSGAAAGATAYQKPSGGIPKSDLSSGVQGSLDLADSAIQARPQGEITPVITPADYATREELGELEAKVNGATSTHTEQTATSTSASFWVDNNGVIGFSASGMGLHRVNAIEVNDGETLDFTTTLGATSANAAFFCDSSDNILQTISRSGATTTWSGKTPTGATKIYINYLSAFTFKRTIYSKFDELEADYNHKFDLQEADYNDKIDKLEVGENLLGFLPFSLGNLSNSGEEIVSTSRARTGYIVKPFSAEVNTGYVLAYLWVYDKNNNGTFSFREAREIGVATITVRDTDGYAYRLTARPDPDADISDVSAILKTYSLLDENKEEIANINNDKLPEIRNGIYFASRTSNNILNQKWENKNLSGAYTASRLLSDYVQLETNTKYVLSFLEDCDIVASVALYDENKQLVKELSPVSGAFYTNGAHYCRIYLRGESNPAQTLSTDLVIPISVYKFEDEFEIEYYPDSSFYWEHGSINDNTGADLNDSPYRARTQYLDIKAPGEVTVIPASGYAMSIYFFDENKALLFRFDPVNETKKVRVMPNFAYYRVLVKNEPDDTTNPISLASVAANGTKISQTYFGQNYAKSQKITISEWNMGLLNDGDSTGGVWGIPDAELDSAIPELKATITEMDADILFLCEYSTFVNRSKTIDTYNYLFKQFYGFSYISSDGNPAIMSKYPLNVTQYVENGRIFIVGNAIVNGERINILLAHLSASSVNARETEISAILNLIGTDNYIIAGDLNIGNNNETEQEIEDQMSLLTDEGFVAGNRGYWGVIPTHKGGTSLDNILVKGAKILKYEVLSSRSVSDHFPTTSTILLTH